MKKKTPDDWKPFLTVPSIAPKPHFFHKKLGQPDFIYEYKTRENFLVGYSCRFEPRKSGEKKAILPLSYGILNGQEGWHWKGARTPIPLFNLEDVLNEQYNAILITEGEKTCIEAKKFFPDYGVVTSYGGSSCAIKSDWTVLHNRDVVIWPDNDTAGIKYKDALIKIFKTVNPKSLRVVQIPSFFPKGWDLADVPPEGVDLNQTLKDSIEISLEEEKEPSRIKLLFEYLYKNLTLILDQHDETFVKVCLRGSYPTCTPLRSKNFKNYIKKMFYDEFEDGISKDNLEQVLDIFEGKSLSLPKSFLNARVSSDKETHWYDLGQCCIKIQKDGWTVRDDPDAIFKTYQGSMSQVLPTFGSSSLDDFIRLFNIPSKEEKLLLKCFLVSSFIYDIPHPVLTIYGPHGSSKSTLTRFLVRLIDPHSIEDVDIYDATELMQTASHRWVLPLDNLTVINSRISDLICKLVTGGGMSKRKLFTDDEDSLRFLKNVVILNGVNIPLKKSDVLDRSILLHLERISPDKRKTEKSLNSEFQNMRSDLLGYSFDILSKALKIRESLELPKHLPRMADFAIWGCAIAEAMNYSQTDFLEAYDLNVRSQNVEVLEDSPLASSIIALMEGCKIKTLTPTELLRLCKSVAQTVGVHEQDLPRSARSLGKQLNYITPNLQLEGFEISRSKSGDRLITIRSPERNVQNEETAKKLQQ